MRSDDWMKKVMTYLTGIGRSTADGDPWLREMVADYERAKAMELEAPVLDRTGKKVTRGRKRWTK